MEGSARLDTQQPAPAVRPGEGAVARGRWSPAGAVKAVVLVALFALLLGSTVVNGDDLVFGFAVALGWTALVALVWELVARAVVRFRRGSPTVG